MTDQPTTTPPTSGGLAPLPTQLCPHCNNVTPSGHYCGVCGVHLAHAGGPLAARRPHSFSANPGEPVLRLSVISSLFPHLSHRASTPFRLGFAALVGLLAIFSATGLQAPVIALAAIGVPLLFQLYVWEVDVYEDDHLLLTAETLLVGAGLGVGWALIGGHIVSEALAPTLGKSLGGWDVVNAAVFVPIVGQALMLVPLLVVLALVPGFGSRRESLDGFTLGAASALGFSFAAVITDMTSQLSAGLVTHEPFTNTLTEALIRGIATPVMFAAATGVVGASIWVRRSEAAQSRGRWLTHPLLLILALLAVEVGLGFADQAQLADIPLLVIHLSATAVVIIALRVGLHYILLHEQRDVAIGPAATCGNCEHVVPHMPFCPSCGVAQVATSKRDRRTGLGSLDAGAVTADNEPFDALEGGVAVPGWPTLAPAATSSPAAAAFPMAPAPAARTHRAHHALVLAMFGAGLAAIAVAVVLTAVANEPNTTPAHKCTDNICSNPPIRTPRAAAGLTSALNISVGGSADPAPGVYNSPDGHFSVALGLLRWPTQISLGGKTSSLISLDFPNVSIGSTQLSGGIIQVADYSGLGGATAQQVVDVLVSKNVASASLAYPVPDPLVGLTPGYGAVFNANLNSSGGQQVTYRILVMAAIKDGVAVVVWAEGPDDPSFPSLPLLDHPSFIDMDVATLGLDPAINSIQWTSSPSFNP